MLEETTEQNVKGMMFPGSSYKILISMVSTQFFYILHRRSKGNLMIILSFIIVVDTIFGYYVTIKYLSVVVIDLERRTTVFNLDLDNVCNFFEHAAMHISVITESVTKNCPSCKTTIVSLVSLLLNRYCYGMLYSVVQREYENRITHLQSL